MRSIAQLCDDSIQLQEQEVKYIVHESILKRQRIVYDSIWKIQITVHEKHMKIQYMKV